MALEEYENEIRDKRERSIIRMRSITNYVMGIILLIIAFIFLFPTEKIAEYLSQKGYRPDTLRMFGILCSIYGIFRIYRGYKKNYFRES